MGVGGHGGLNLQGQRERIAALKQKGSEIRPVLSGFAFDPDKPLRIKQPYQQPRGGDY